MLTQSGITKDGMVVIRGVFRIFETDGLPLDVIFDVLRERNYIPDWEGFVLEAEAAGMNRNRILLKLDAAIADTYGTEMRDIVIKRIHRIFK